MFHARFSIFPTDREPGTGYNKIMVAYEFSSKPVSKKSLANIITIQFFILFGLENEKLEFLTVLHLEVEHVCPKRMLFMVGPY